MLLYPQAYSSKAGTVVVPETAGQQWYYGNITDEGGILSGGKVKEKYASLFEAATVEANGKTFPALKIVGNLATEADHSDKYIYYKSSYQGKDFTCQQLIPIQESVGDSLRVLITCAGADGSGDNVLSADNDWVQFTASLQRSGVTVTDGVTYQWQRYVGGAWTDMETVDALFTVSGASLKCFDAGVEGVELFRCVATYGGQQYMGSCEATDIHDPFYVEPGRSIPRQSVLPGETVTYSPKVYERATGAEQDGWTFAYSFVDNDGQALDDLTKDNLTYANIAKHGGFAVRIEASK